MTTEPIDWFHRQLHHIPPGRLVSATAQTPGMRRLEAISGKTVGAENLWMGETHVPPDTSSANHHHGHSETAIYVVSGHPSFVFLEPGRDGLADREIRIDTGPGDYVFVPPWVPHREENPDPDEAAVVVIARTTQEAIVVNVPDLTWVGPARTTARVPDQSG
ncbi:cupin domain-containing protein [Microlunatus ginsengisoli]|uniref:Cupin domain-containing protein n=2 Tax=Microlunatus ginsengisoli TaxID=363863 RepID=A0ABP7AHZ3_9ACTN